MYFYFLCMSVWYLEKWEGGVGSPRTGVSGYPSPLGLLKSIHIQDGQVQVLILASQVARKTDSVWGSSRNLGLWYSEPCTTPPRCSRIREQHPTMFPASPILRHLWWCRKPDLFKVSNNTGIHIISGSQRSSRRRLEDPSLNSEHLRIMGVFSGLYKTLAA